jgi:hypothetical protein
VFYICCCSSSGWASGWCARQQQAAHDVMTAAAQPCGTSASRQTLIKGVSRCWKGSWLHQAPGCCPGPPSNGLLLTGDADIQLPINSATHFLECTD